MCREHAVQKLINKGRFFKFVLELNCDCDFHEQINVLNVPAKISLLVVFCLSRLFMLNHMVYKICIKNEDAFIKDLPTISDFLSSLTGKMKFYYNESRNLIEHVNFR